MAEKYGRTKIYHTDMDTVMKKVAASGTAVSSVPSGAAKPRINESTTKNAKEINYISDEIDDRLDVSYKPFFNVFWPFFIP